MIKPTNATVILLALLLVAGMIVSPVCATTYTPINNVVVYETDNVVFDQVYNVSYDASLDGMRVSLLSFTIPSDSKVDFTLYYGNGSTVSGYSENHHINFLQTSTTVNLNGVSNEYTYIDTQPFYDFNFAGYAEARDSNDILNTTAAHGFLVYSLNYGALDNDLAVFFEVPNPSQNTIFKVEASCTKPFMMEVRTGQFADVAKGASKNLLEIAWEWINLAIALGGTILAFLVGDPIFSGGVYWWIKFFFIDNLILVIVMYFAVTMAYSAITSRGNVFRFYKSFFGYQRALYQFIISLWETFVNILASFRGIFRL